MSISDYLENKILDKVFRAVDFTVTARYTSLHSANPGETGASEITGGSYARQLTTFIVAAGGATENDAAITYTNMPAVTISHVAIWDAATLGNCLWTGALTTPKTLNAGDTFQIPIGDLDVTLD